MKKILVKTIANICGITPRPGRCIRCQRIINEEKEFRDVVSFKEWRLTRLCQQCQDWALATSPSDDD